MAHAPSNTTTTKLTTSTHTALHVLLQTEWVSQAEGKQAKLSPTANKSAASTSQQGKKAGVHGGQR